MMRVLRMFAVSAAATAALATAGWAQNPQGFLSWNTCPTVTGSMTYTTATIYNMVVGVKNVTAADQNVGTDFQIYYGPNVPDSWRFDDAGCQTGSQVALTNSTTKACPSMKGANSLAITNLAMEPTGAPGGLSRMNVRLSITYDAFTPAPATTYTVWNVAFNHAFSNTGPTPPDNSTCGGAEQPLCFTMTNTTDPAQGPSFLLTTTNINEYFTFATPSEQFLLWNSATGCPGSVPTTPSTWGGIKALYH